MQTSGIVGLVALGHVESSWIGHQTRVPCIGSWILYHWTTEEVLLKDFYRLKKKKVPSASGSIMRFTPASTQRRLCQLSLSLNQMPVLPSAPLPHLCAHRCSPAPGIPPSRGVATICFGVTLNVNSLRIALAEPVGEPWSPGSTKW